MNILFIAALLYKADPESSPANCGCKIINGYLPAGKIIGTNEGAQTANNSLHIIRLNLLNIRTDLQSQGKPITAELVVNTHLGKSITHYSLIQLHEYHNEHHVKKLIGKDYAEGTYARYKTSLDHITRFVSHKYKTSDIFIHDVNNAFAAAYEFYLKTVRNCSTNTTSKYVKNLKTVINFAVSRGYIPNNPIQSYKAKLQRIEKEFLTEKEIHSIESKKIDIDRLVEARDVFIFCCYTGLSYSDSAKLSNQNIVIGMNGKKQIHIKRTKTDVPANIPLLPKALEIIEKYKEHESCIYSGKLLPTKSNQKQNAYLKEIATLAECPKKLTTHTARHTFATLMLTKGVSIETVSSMLGHTNIKTTQIYAKIIEEKVMNEMSKIADQLVAI
ncbi:MAG TPA: site-specific integrase [Chitinophagaceae bacterium]|nr:site-specific integrase [Chitinophagaceae bacterium]